MSRALAAGALVVLVAGCSSSAGPVALPPVSAAPGGTPSPAVTTPAATPPVTPSARPTAVERPAEADEATAAGAEAFARYWMAVRNEAYRTLQPGELIRISAQECVTCSAYARSMNRGRAAGERWEGGLAEVFGVAAPPVVDSVTRVLIDYRQSPFKALDKSGRVLAQQPAREKATIEMVVERAGQQWLAREVRRL